MLPPKDVDPYYRGPEHKDWSRQVIANAQGCCQRCNKTGLVLIADHIVEINDGGSPLDLDNGQALCLGCHNIKTGEEKAKRKAPLDVAANNRPDWLKPSLIPLTIVCGPPASGKSAYVAEKKWPQDLVIDLDQIASALSGQSLHGWDRSWLNAAIRQRNQLLSNLSCFKATRWSRAWLILTAPKAQDRQWWFDRLLPGKVVVLETPDEVCCQRINDSDRPRKAEQSQAVYRWWLEYTRRPGDKVIAFAS